MHGTDPIMHSMSSKTQIGVLGVTLPCKTRVVSAFDKARSKVAKHTPAKNERDVVKPSNSAKMNYFRRFARHPAMRFRQVGGRASDAQRGNLTWPANSQSIFTHTTNNQKIFQNCFRRMPAHHNTNGDVTICASYMARNPPLARNSCAGKILFIDAFTAGIAGDMFVAALVDLGVPLELVKRQLTRLDLQGNNYELNIMTTSRSAITAPLFSVRQRKRNLLRLRTFKEIKSLIEGSVLTRGSKHKALKTFELLAEAESSAHGISSETVHFHEVGALDSIVDTVAVAVCLDYLGVNEVVVSALPMGRGLICGAAHGPLPCPAPATVQCLCAADLLTYATQSDGEFVTPTGASLVATLKTSVGDWPRRFRQERIGYGAGINQWRGRPNLLRIVLGTVEEDK
jgi:hypothetical protein